jgi:hypothetical protein
MLTVIEWKKYVEYYAQRRPVDEVCIACSTAASAVVRRTTWMMSSEDRVD